MEELIQRLERAEHSSRELDAAIAVQMGINPDYRGDGRYGCRHYTSSLDAALTLVPEGWDWFKTPTVGRFSRAEVVSIEPTKCSFYGTADTPALALCIAALRARQEQR